MQEQPHQHDDAALASLPGVLPAFIYRYDNIMSACGYLRAALAGTESHLLYSTKACGVSAVLAGLQPIVDGFAVSSPREAQLAATVMRGAGTLHLTSPGLTSEWLTASPGVTHVAFNSLSQWTRLQGSASGEISCGLRINPMRSTSADIRYDPCRPYSKLGVPLRIMTEHQTELVRGRLKGLHCHNACQSGTWIPLLDTVTVIERSLGPLLRGLDWFNLGGGYVWDAATDYTPLQEVVNLLERRYGLRVFLEPGAGIVNGAGYLIASVVDLFENDGKCVAVLDTTVNHLPEVFEYQYEPDVLEHVENAPNEYVLAGCTCLAGDVFGEYAFEEPLQLGSRLTFMNVGAYSLVKAHCFNGVPVPATYLLDGTRLQLVRVSTCEDFVTLFGAHRIATI